MVNTADTSFLFSLYGNDAHTPKALHWLKTNRTALDLTFLHEFELGNALRFAEFRKAIAPGDAARFLAQFDADKVAGRIRIQPCNLADIVQQAKRLSATHTLVSGHRAFDILHVAAALVMGARQLLTFDANQMTLAKAEGLRIPNWSKR